MTEIKGKNDELSNSRLMRSSDELKAYMTASNECDFVQKRLKMLARVEAHNKSKLHLNQKSLERIESLRALKQDNSQEKQELLKKRKELEQKQKEQNKRIKDDMKGKLNEVLKEIEVEKIQDRNKIREQSKSIALKIQEMKEKELQEKRNKRNQVIEREKESKENYKTYFHLKKEELIKRAESEVSLLSDKKTKKQKQIEKLIGVEEKILERNEEILKEFSDIELKLSGVYNIEPTPLSRIIRNSRTHVSETLHMSENGEKSMLKETNTNLSENAKN